MTGKTLSAARRHRGQYLAHLGLVGGDGLHDAVNQTLMATQLLAHYVPQIVTSADADEKMPGL
jgi:hypothetical protein